MGSRSCGNWTRPSSPHFPDGLAGVFVELPLGFMLLGSLGVELSYRPGLFGVSPNAPFPPALLPFSPGGSGLLDSQPTNVSPPMANDNTAMLVINRFMENTPSNNHISDLDIGSFAETGAQR